MTWLLIYFFIIRYLRLLGLFKIISSDSATFALLILIRLWRNSRFCSFPFSLTEEIKIKILLVLSGTATIFLDHMWGSIIFLLGKIYFSKTNADLKFFLALRYATLGNEETTVLYFLLIIWIRPRSKILNFVYSKAADCYIAKPSCLSFVFP